MSQSFVKHSFWITFISKIHHTYIKSTLLNHYWALTIAMCHIIMKFALICQFFLASGRPIAMCLAFSIEFTDVCTVLGSPVALEWNVRFSCQQIKSLDIKKVLPIICLLFISSCSNMTFSTIINPTAIKTSTKPNFIIAACHENLCDSTSFPISSISS